MQERKSLIPDGTVIPVPEHRRVSTDVCCTIISSIFALTLFIIACVFYSSGKLYDSQLAFTPPTSRSRIRTLPPTRF